MTSGINLIKELDISKETQDKIEKIAEIRSKYNPEVKETELASKLANEVLSELFKTPYSFMIPYDFIESEIGTLIFETKFIYQNYYSTFDIGIILDRTNSAIYHNYQTGNLGALNKGGLYLVPEGSLRKYMKINKKMTDQEIEKRLNTFWEIKKKQDKRVLRSEMKKIYKEALEK